jgi:hypothetical protein
MELLMYGVIGFLIVVVPAFLFGFFKNAKKLGKDIEESKRKKKKEKK